MTYLSFIILENCPLFKIEYYLKRRNFPFIRTITESHLLWTCLFKTSQLFAPSEIVLPLLLGGALPYLDSFILSSNHICFLHCTLFSGNLITCIFLLPPPRPQTSLSLLLYCVFFFPSPLCHPSLFVSLFQLLSLDVDVLTGHLQSSKHSCKYFICTINFILSFNPPSNFMR